MNENALYYVTALFSCLLPSCVRDDDGPTGSEIPRSPQVSWLNLWSPVGYIG